MADGTAVEDLSQDRGFEGLDELFDKWSGDDTPSEPEPDPDDDTPDADDEDTPEEEPEDEAEDTDDDDEAEEEEPEELEGDEEDEEDEDEDDESEDEEDEEEEDVLENVSAEEKQRINEDPALSKLYKLMQRNLTKKTTAAAERERVLDTKEQDFDKFADHLRTGDGMADYLANLLDQNHSVVGAAFERVATGENGRNGVAFLVEVGRTHPELFEAAQEQIQEFEDDPDSLKRYTKERELQSKEMKIKQREDRIRFNRFTRDFEKLRTVAEKEIERIGVIDEDKPEVVEQLKALTRKHYREDGSIDVTPAQVKEVVRAAKARAERYYEKARRDLERQNTKTSRAKTKERARKAKAPKRVPPKSVPRKKPKEKEVFTPEDNKDAIDSFVDYRLSQT